jgi:acetyl esterase/lipase
VLDDPFEAGAFYLAPDVVANGWTLVATDYVGLGAGDDHPYLVGEPAGRSVLDAVRAARQLDGVVLSEQTVVWGHSQGGHAALWTGIVAPDYAPDVPLSGVAALAPASDLPGLVGNLDTLPGGAIFASYVVEGYADAYDDLTYRDAVRPAANVLVGELAARCLSGPEVLVSVAETLIIDQPVIADDAVDGPFGARLAENVPTGPIEAPLFLGQGETDELVLPEAQAGFAALRCEVGGAVEYRTYPDRDHVGVVRADSPLVPDLLRWTGDRLAGEPAASTCEG